jgi:hypothetical protein
LCRGTMEEQERYAARPATPYDEVMSVPNVDT